ncbi:hypothetical protein [Labedaea rhizosphaerae]|uniref:Uncharacterized protein n=1 Tax=Labedaea rhizosphaerae TaxID=598644 RepID=A0A4R6SI98_LABRH|nr:hypothetical protein [Labedaea rhizosphaerae]TDQ00599.1 hypothetical protein EV186_102460 [Labedaea rhizosphaerae]
MAMQLPTDTQHLRFETRQYELFHRPLGQGVARNKLAVGAAATGMWAPVLFLCGLSPLTELGPLLYVGPVAGFVVLGTRLDDTGLMHLIGWLDALRVRAPRRRRVIDNPLLRMATDRPAQVLSVAVHAELVPPGGG